MSFLTSWFKKRGPPEDFESVLAGLKADIERRQRKMAEIRLRERRTTLLLTLYTLVGWAAYAGVWYLQPAFLPHLGGERGTPVEGALKAVPVFLGPILILFTRRIAQLWYTRKGDLEEKTLQQLRKEQRRKIEEFKKQTKFYETQNLLAKFDDAHGSPRRGGTPGPAPAGTPGAPAPAPAVPSAANTPVRSPARPVVQTTPSGRQLPAHLAASPPQPQVPPRKQWYDKVADAILGDDDATSGASGAVSRYALICQRCFAHNGLVKESVWEDTQYVCPKCGYMNPSVRAKREGRAPATPMSTMPSIAPTPVTPAPVAWSQSGVGAPAASRVPSAMGAPAASRVPSAGSPAFAALGADSARQRLGQRRPTTVREGSSSPEGYTMEDDA